MHSKQVKQRRMMNALRRSMTSARRKSIHQRCRDIQRRWIDFDVEHGLSTKLFLIDGWADDEKREAYRERVTGEYHEKLLEWETGEYKISRRHFREDFDAGFHPVDLIEQQAYVNSAYNNNAFIPLYAPQTYRWTNHFGSEGEDRSEYHTVYDCH